MKFFTLMLSCLFFFSCSVKPPKVYTENRQMTVPNYADLDHWAAHPEKVDSADRVPDPSLVDRQASSPIDVFFLHPTTYTGERGHNQWNGPIDDPKLNEKTDRSAILNQASIFNGTGRVFAPRYRQAHLHTYFTKKHQVEAQKALELAFQDVKRAFEYYLQHHNANRPFIIATHSQGSTHGMRLIKEFVEGTPLQEKLVVAYLVGMHIEKDYFNTLQLCQTAEETNCFCSWRTFKKGALPKKFPTGKQIAVTNPLTWTTEEDSYAEQSENQGAVLAKFEKGTVPALVDAQIHEGVLWVNKPKFPGSFLITTPNYHVADFNLFYLNVRQNAEKRAAVYSKKNGL